MKREKYILETPEEKKQINQLIKVKTQEYNKFSDYMGIRPKENRLLGVGERSKWEKENSSPNNKVNSVNWNVIKSKKFKDKFKKLGYSDELSDKLYDKSIQILKHRDNTLYEDMYLISLDGKVKASQTKVEYIKSKDDNTHIVLYNKEIYNAIKNNLPNTLVSLHNHISTLPPSGSDFYSQFQNKYHSGIITCFDGTLYQYKVYGKGENFSELIYDLTVAKYEKREYTLLESYEKALEDLREKYKIEWRKI